MNKVFPEAMNQLPSDSAAALGIIDKYIRYMCERTDFAIKHVVSEGGMTEAQLHEYVSTIATDIATEIATDIATDISVEEATQIVTELAPQIATQIATQIAFSNDMINFIHNHIMIPVNPTDTTNINLWIEV